MRYLIMQNLSKIAYANFEFIYYTYNYKNY